MGVYVEVPLDETELTLEMIGQRIADRRAEFEAKVAKKTISQDKYLETTKASGNAD